MENNIENIDKKLPFEVPEGYFDSFEEKMMVKFEELERETENSESGFEKVRDLNANGGGNKKWRKLATGVAAAAVVLAGIFAILHLQNDVAQTGEEIVVAATTSADEAYYDEINSELNTEEIEEALAQIEFEEEY